MTFANFARTLQIFSRRGRRFQPYRVQLMTGETLLVRHQEALAFRGQLIVFTEPNEQTRVFDAESVCQFIDPPRPGQAAAQQPSEG
jgi:hypothetical protein